MEAFFLKINGALYPASPNDAEMLGKIKAGQPVRMKLTRVRNYEFHKKYFALLNLAFDYWEPPEDGLGAAWSQKFRIDKNFDQFRKDIIILAGYFNATYRINGDVRFEAKSIAFSNMSEDEFEELYTKTIDVIVKHVLSGYTGEMLRSVLEQVEAFE